MSKTPAVLLPPHHEYHGNLLWNPSDVSGLNSKIESSIEQLRGLNYWASPFPEGDGVTFAESSGEKSVDEISIDFKKCFLWLEISLDPSRMNQVAPKRSPIPSLGFEDAVKLKKSDIALTQLEDAIEIFLVEKRLSAITLAAASDGIFSGLLKQEGEKSAAEDTWEGIEQAREITGLSIAGDLTKKDAFNEWNWFHNRLKHHDERDDAWLEINICDSACYAIQRALADAKRLGLEPRNRFQFEEWMFENIYT